MEAAQEAIKQGHHELRPYVAKACHASVLTGAAFTYIDSLKRELIKYTEDVKGADTLSLAQVQRLDDYDKPTYLLIGSDETKPRSGEYSATELRHVMRSLVDSLSTMLEVMRATDGLRLPDDDYKVLKEKLKLFTPH